jgi:hypothetical protein
MARPRKVSRDIHFPLLPFQALVTGKQLKRRVKKETVVYTVMKPV